MLLNKFDDFNLIFAIVYSHNTLLSRSNTILNNISYLYSNNTFYYISILLIASSITKSAQILFSV